MIEMQRWQRGSEIPITVQCHGSDGTPSNPDLAPVLALFDGSTLILRQKMPSDAKAHQPGVFRLPVFLDARFPSSGQISGAVQWTKGGVVFSETVTFSIIPGGDTDGSVIATTFVRRPGLGALVWQTDAGTIMRGSNPRSQR